MVRVLRLTIILMLMTSYCVSLGAIGDNQNVSCAEDIIKAVADAFSNKNSDCIMYDDEISYNILNGYINYPNDEIPSNYYEEDYKFCKKEYCNLSNPTFSKLYSFIELPFWTYEMNGFDCSEMAAYMEHRLECCRYDAKICVSNNFAGKGLHHAWVAIDTYAPDKNSNIRYFLDGTNWGFLSSLSFNLVPDDVIIEPTDDRYIYYSNYDKIFDDIYAACRNTSVEEWNWWHTLKKSLDETNPSYPIATVYKSVKPGLIELDLGDGYSISFELKDTKKAPYDIIIYTPVFGLIGSKKTYSLDLRANKSEWSRHNGNQFPTENALYIMHIHLKVGSDLRDCTMNCDYPGYSRSKLIQCLPKLGIEENNYCNRYYRTEVTFREIDNWAGYTCLTNEPWWLKTIGSQLNPKKDFSSYNFWFMYYPGARDWENLKSFINVGGNSLDPEQGAVNLEELNENLPVIYGILDSIHVQGPMIPN